MKGNRYLPVIFLLITIGCSSGPSSETKSVTTNEADSLSLSKKKAIQDFWTLYRAATKDRIAGSWQEAADGYAAALELNANHEDARYYLANMYLELAEFNKAEENWYRLLEFNPESSRAHVQLGKLYFNYKSVEYFDPEQAALKFQKAIDINQDFLQPVLNLAEIAIIQENYLASQERLRVVLGSDDKNIEAWFLMGFIDFKNGNKKDANTKFIKACELSVPQNAENGVTGEGDTKTGKSLERGIHPSIFDEYFKNLQLDSAMEVEQFMQIRYTKLNNFIVELQNI